MRKKNYKGRVTKRYLPKCNDICRTYDPIMTAYADLLSKLEEVEEFRCNVYLEGLTEGDYTTDFLVKMKDEERHVMKMVGVSVMDMPTIYFHRESTWSIYRFLIF